MKKIHMCIFTPEQLDIVKRGLELMKDTFEVRAREASIGPFAPDEEHVNEALRELETTNSTIEVCDDPTNAYFKAD